MTALGLHRGLADVRSRPVRATGQHAVVSDRRWLWSRNGHDRRVPAAGVMLVAVVLAIWVFSITRDPVRSLGIVYIAGLLIFTVHEAHDAWQEPRIALR